MRLPKPGRPIGAQTGTEASRATVTRRSPVQPSGLLRPIRLWPGFVASALRWRRPGGSLAQQLIEIFVARPSRFGRLERVDLSLVGRCRVRPGSRRSPPASVAPARPEGRRACGLVSSWRRMSGASAGDDLQAEAVGAQPQALVAVLAEQQRLAVDEVDLGLGLVGLGGDAGRTRRHCRRCSSAGSRPEPHPCARGRA